MGGEDVGRRPDGARQEGPGKEAPCNPDGADEDAGQQAGNAHPAPPRRASRGDLGGGSDLTVVALGQLSVAEAAFTPRETRAVDLRQHGAEEGPAHGRTSGAPARDGPARACG